MKARWILAALLTAASTQTAHAQALQFRWTKGQVLTYKVKQHTAVAEVVDGNKVESESKLDLVKRWQVIDVDGQGVATVQLSLAALRTEQKRPGGDTLLFDSQDLEHSTPDLKEQMGKYVGQTLAVLRVDALGNTLEAKQGSMARYQAEPPFAIVLGKSVMAEGASWARPYAITVEPPLGTGETYDAQQQYRCLKLAGNLATIAVKTEIKMPEIAQERLPLLQKEVEGTAEFDLQTGCLRSANLHIDRTIEQHQGPRSSYHFRSEYREDLFSPGP